MKQVILALVIVVSMMMATSVSAGPRDPDGNPPPPPIPTVGISDAFACDTSLDLTPANIEQAMCRTATHVKMAITGATPADTVIVWVDDSCTFVTNIAWFAIEADADLSQVTADDYSAYFICANDLTRFVILPDDAIFDLEELVLVNLPINDQFQTFVLPLFGLTPQEFSEELAEVYTDTAMPSV